MFLEGHSDLKTKVFLRIVLYYILRRTFLPKNEIFLGIFLERPLDQ